MAGFSGNYSAITTALACTVIKVSKSLRGVAILVEFQDLIIITKNL